MIDSQGNFKDNVYKSFVSTVPADGLDLFGTMSHEN